MDSTDPSKAALSNATAFKHENPDEKASAAARIYSVNESTVRQALFRERQRDGKAAQHGGHNRILSDVQIDAIYKYVEDSYMSGYGATKLMVHAAIGCLKANQVPPREQPSWRWFQQFMKDHPDLLKVIKTKAIARVRVSAADVEEVKEWFHGFRTYCEKYDIKAGDVLNFDEAGFRVGVAPRCTLQLQRIASQLPLSKL
jgi:hypothetical protein